MHFITNQNSPKNRITVAITPGVGAEFTDLDTGLYLFVHNNTTAGYYPIAPFVLSIPTINAEGTSWIYDIEVKPKVEPIPPELLTEITVVKKWEDKGVNRPNNVSVTLMRDGTSYDVVNLNKDNNWTYTWTKLENKYRWTVAEDPVPAGYTVKYSGTATKILITNTIEGYNDKDDDDDDDPEPENPVINTGQLNWPVPVLAISGIVLFTIGWVAKYGRKGKDNES